MDCLPEVVHYLAEVQTISYDLSKSLAIDASLFKYKPSILGASLLFLGFQLQFEIMIDQGAVDLISKHKRLVIGQISTIFTTWKSTVLGQILKVSEIPKIITFCDHVMQRQIQLYAEYHAQFPNIYKERVAEYFRPPKVSYEDLNQRICRTTESPMPREQEIVPVVEVEDVEMADETEPTYTAEDEKTFDYRKGQSNGSDMMIIQ